MLCFTFKLAKLGPQNLFVCAPERKKAGIGVDSLKLHWVKHAFLTVDKEHNLFSLTLAFLEKTDSFGKGVEIL
jgi:hypothetical protein